jgi:hypothetical protein
LRDPPRPATKLVEPIMNKCINLEEKGKRSETGFVGWVEALRDPPRPAKPRR